MAVRDIIVIGASEGGVRAVSGILAALPAGLPAAIVIVVHTAPWAPVLLPQILVGVTGLVVSAAADGQTIEPGHVYVAPPDRHVIVEPGRLRLSDGPKEKRSRPAADPLFRSAAAHYGPRVVGVVLTGADGDGTAGARAIKRQGGLVVVQDPDEAQNPSMPRHALLRGDPDFRVSLVRMPALLITLIQMPIGALPAG